MTNERKSTSHFPAKGTKIKRVETCNIEHLLSKCESGRKDKIYFRPEELFKM